MGKASKWFRGLLGLKTTDNNQTHSPKKKWSLAKEKDRHKDNEASKHAIAVAAVVQLTSSGRMGCDSRREEWAAVTIQSHFRAYLSRRALRALKALVKLQALVRGHLVRKQTAYALRRLQALVRAQLRARVGRALNYASPQSTTKSYLRNVSNHNLEKPQARRMLIHDNNRMSGRLFDQAGSFPNKILEVDTGNPHKHRPTTLFYPDHHVSQSLSTSTAPAQSFCEVQSHEDESAYDTLTYFSVSSTRRAFTPTKSDGTRSCLSGYSDHPNYMSYTESSKAKVRRSLSAPKQRPHFERSSSVKRYSVHGSTQFTNKVYPGSGRLDRAGMPVRGEITVATDIRELCPIY